jgi:hypothetical protein
MKVLHSEEHVQQLLKSRYDIVLNKIDEHGGKNGRTSDFEFVIDGRRAFVCELKDFIDIPLTEKYGFTVVNHPNGIVEAHKKHNATNRISDAIAGAYEQLSRYPEPKILAILNFSRFLGVEDLVETYKGYRVLGVEDGITYLDTYARRASEGKIKDIKKAIDLYIWIDSSSKDSSFRKDEVFLKTTTEIGERLRKEFFGKSSTAA